MREGRHADHLRHRCGARRDAGRLGALLALDQTGFDEDFTGGWRTVAARPGSDAAAAHLVELWRDYSPFLSDAAAVNRSAGQMRAPAKIRRRSRFRTRPAVRDAGRGVI
ncbi:MAG: hypothetical protein ACOC05_01985 [Oceanicaulis sp.]